MLLVAGDEPVLHREGHVTPAIDHGRILMQKIGRQIDKKLGVVRWDEFEPLAAIEVGDIARRRDLMYHVKAKFLFETRRNRGNWSDPVGLLGLRG